MELINATRMLTSFTVAMDRTAREHLVVAIKGTFRFPDESSDALRLDEEQFPLVLGDVFFGEPGLSAPKYEADFVLRKRHCDVLLNATAWAPEGRPVTRLPVEVRIADWSKGFTVVGDRVWVSTAAGVLSSAAVPFAKMPITYDRAFGGADNRHANPSLHSAYAANPSGRGFHKHPTHELVDGTPLPNTEESDTPVAQPNGAYRPMSFGVLGRHWEPRRGYAGTYDQHWLDEVFPFLPSDFDDRYYQAAPLDQQIELPTKELRVRLTNLTEKGTTSFTIPHLEAPVHVFTKGGAREDLVAQVDTIVIEPDEGRVTLTWRVARPLKRNIFEIAQVLVGRKGTEWWQQRERQPFPVPLLMMTSTGQPVQMRRNG